jgi:hypothetical protein
MVTRLHPSVPLRRCGDAIEVKSPFGDAIVHVLDCSLRPCGKHLRAVVLWSLASRYHGGGHNRPMHSI